MGDDGFGEVFVRAGCRGWLCVAAVFTRADPSQDNEHEINAAIGAAAARAVEHLHRR